MSSTAHKSASRFEDWQPRTSEADLRSTKPSPIRLDHFDPDARPFSTGDKTTDRAALEALAEDINSLQELLYASKSHKVLVVLQGLDAAGKDGTLRGVFSRTSPLGVRTVGWKAPSDLERTHDYLWRIHAAMPHDGEIMLFNRSHYEDVLVPVVDHQIDDRTTRQRYAQINDFERMLTENGTVIIKCMLLISKDEQRQRLQARIDDPTKNWKFNVDDLETRKHWDDYMAAYAALLGATSTPWAPWTIVPANSKTHRNLMIATLVRDVLQSLGLHYPPAIPELRNLHID